MVFDRYLNAGGESILRDSPLLYGFIATAYEIPTDQYGTQLLHLINAAGKLEAFVL